MTETEIDSKEWKKRHDRYWKIMLAMSMLAWSIGLVIIYQFGFLAGQASMKVSAGL